MMAQELESKRERRENDRQRFGQCHIFSTQGECRTDGCGQAHKYCGSIRERTREKEQKEMSEDMKAELQHWQGRTDEMQVALDRMRDERDLWKTTCETQTILLNKSEDLIKQLRSMIDRIQVAMSQGQEL
jgi:hypothetical protein